MLLTSASVFQTVAAKNTWLINLLLLSLSCFTDHVIVKKKFFHFFFCRHWQNINNWKAPGKNVLSDVFGSLFSFLLQSAGIFACTLIWSQTTSLQVYFVFRSFSLPKTVSAFFCRNCSDAKLLRHLCNSLMNRGIFTGSPSSL